jgi:hypothetical protein
MGKKQRKKIAERTKAVEFHPHFALDYIQAHELPLPDIDPTMSLESPPLSYTEYVNHLWVVNAADNFAI